MSKNFTCIAYMLLCSIERRIWSFQFKTYLFVLFIFSSIIFFPIFLLLMVMFSVWFDVSCFGFYINRRLFVCMIIRHSWEKEKKRQKEKRRQRGRNRVGGRSECIYNLCNLIFPVRFVSGSSFQCVYCTACHTLPSRCYQHV